MEDETQPLLGASRKRNVVNYSTTPPQGSDVVVPSCAKERLRVKQSIGLFSGTFLVVGVIVGSGVFISPNLILKSCNGSVGISLIMWVLGGIVAIMSTLCYNELSSSITESGGDYTFMRHAYGPALAFLLPWMNCFFPTTDALAVLAFASYAIQPFFPAAQPLPQNAVKLLAMAVVLMVYAMNCYSVKLAVRFQVLFTAIKILTIAFIIGSALYYSGRYPSNAYTTFSNMFDPGPIQGITFLSISNVFYQVTWSYEGWNALCHANEEVDSPRNVALASVFGIVISVIIMLFINVSYLMVLTPQQMMESTTVALSFSQQIFSVGLWLVAVTVCLVNFGTFNSSVITYSRTVYVAARNGHFPQIFGMIQVNYLTPLPCLILNAIPTLVLVAIGDFSTLIDAFGFTSWTFYFFSSLSVLILRRKYPTLPRPFRVPTIIPIIMTILSVFFVVFPIVTNPHFLYFYSLAFFAVGLFVYYLLIHRGFQVPGMKPTTIFLQKLLNAAREDLAPVGE